MEMENPFLTPPLFRVAPQLATSFPGSWKPEEKAIAMRKKYVKAVLEMDIDSKNTKQRRSK